MFMWSLGPKGYSFQLSFRLVDLIWSKIGSYSFLYPVADSTQHPRPDEGDQTVAGRFSPQFLVREGT